MLVLERQPTESIVIDDNIVITVVRVKGNQVRFSIDAPEDVAVWREEIYDRLHEDD
jgi:carbon storage regulator